MTIYETLGVTPIINASGPQTRLSGAVMAPEVVAAMAEAGQACVDIEEMQAAAGRKIASATGAEAGMVTAGASAGLLLATAACVAGLDPSRMNRLPDTRGMKNQVLIARSHRNFYDHAVRAVGVELVEIGIPDRFSGAGQRDAEPWEFAAAIGEATAAILYVAQPHARPAFAEIVKAAGDVPVIVDAAGQLPPAENLRRFFGEGAALVTFSGGKAIGGPQASGILAGKRELIASALLQQLDQDVRFEFWTPRHNALRKAEIPGLPQHGIGRSCKVGKEQIAGLMVALDRFLAEDPAKRQARWHGEIEAMRREIGQPNGVQAEIVGARGGVPNLKLTVGEGSRLSADELYRALLDSRPSIRANPDGIDDGVIKFGPLCLRPGEAQTVGRRIAELCGTRRPDAALGPATGRLAG